MENRDQCIIRIDKKLTARSANGLVRNWQWGQPYFTMRLEDFEKVNKSFRKKYGVEYRNYHIHQHACVDPATGQYGILFIRT